MRTSIICTVQLCIAVTVLSAQAPKPPTGTVTGHVICQDTQRPARFAGVIIFSVPSAVTPTPDKVDTNDPKSMRAFMKAQGDAMNSATLIIGETGFDGRFLLGGIEPGDYYVMASLGGYLQPREIAQAAVDAGEDITKGIGRIPMVHVSADRSVDAEITVTRGAAIEGHVLWDDGTPINAAEVFVDPKTGEYKPLPMQFNMGFMNRPFGTTDDRGHYRISGLAPGEYTVRALLSTNQHVAMRRGQFDSGNDSAVMPLMVYAPGGFRRTDAKPFTLAAGDERMDEDITFNLSVTHTVSCRVTSAEDHHGLNRGMVMLRDSVDKNFGRSASLDADGNFSVTFVPSGTYTMTVMNGADTVLEEPKKPDQNAIFMQSQTRTVRTYQQAEQQVMVAGDDLTGENIELKPMKSPESDTQTGNQ